MAGAWQVQERLESLADGADNPKGLQGGLATMSAVVQQRAKLQVHICSSLGMGRFLCSVRTL